MNKVINICTLCVYIYIYIYIYTYKYRGKPCWETHLQILDSPVQCLIVGKQSNHIQDIQGGAPYLDQLAYNLNNLDV